MNPNSLKQDILIETGKSILFRIRQLRLEMLQMLWFEGPTLMTLKNSDFEAQIGDHRS